MATFVSPLATSPIGSKDGGMIIWINIFFVFGFNNRFFVALNNEMKRFLFKTLIFNLKSG